MLGYNSTYFSSKLKKVKHATPRNKWSVCWSSSSITYLSPLEGHCFSRSSAYQCVRIVSLSLPIYFYTHMSRSFFKSLQKIRRFMRLEPLISHTGILINYSRFAEFLPLIYPPELEVKETTDRASSASILDLYLEFDECGQLSTKIYDKRDDFKFIIINFPNMCSNIPASPAYSVYISRLIRYARASSNYS